MDADIHAAQLAATQHGIVALHHLELLGIDEHDRKHLLATGALVRERHGAYRAAGAPSSWKGELLAACWAGGVRAAASHRSAAALWDIPGGDRSIQEISCPRWRRAHVDGLVVHESLALPDADITTLDGIPATTIERTLVDLGAVERSNVVERALEAALRRELTTLGAVHAALTRVAKRGRRGVGTMRAILDERDADRQLTDTDRELMMLQIFRRNGIPDPIPQFVIREQGRFIARVDAALPAWRIAFEYESYEWHTGKLALVRDSRRRNDIVAARWLPIAVTSEDLWTGGLIVCSRVLEIIRRAS